METKLQQVHTEKREQSNAYSLYLFGMRSPVTKDTYLRRLRIFFNHIQLLSINEPMEVRCNEFARMARSDQDWAFTKILEFLQFQKEGVEGRKI